MILKSYHGPDTAKAVEWYWPSLPADFKKDLAAEMDKPHPSETDEDRYQHARKIRMWACERGHNLLDYE
jgi:hypothetical protein